MRIDNRDVLEIIVENSVKKSSTSYKLKLLDINEDILEVPAIHMDVITTLPSMDFQRITRDMGNLANDITITRDGTMLELACQGDFADQRTVIEYPEHVERVGNVFSLKYINLFTKATGMCSSVQLMQDSQNDGVIVFRYSIANLGDMKFYLAAKMDS
jgi:proliferating cell nuclear antigen